jgi:hypothetical protein
MLEKHRRKEYPHVKATKSNLKQSKSYAFGQDKQPKPKLGVALGMMSIAKNMGVVRTPETKIGPLLTFLSCDYLPIIFLFFAFAATCSSLER